MSRRYTAALVALIGLIALVAPMSSAPAGAEVKTMDLAMVPNGGTLTLRGSDEPAPLESPTTLVGSVDEFTGIISAASFATTPLEFEFPITQPLRATVFVKATFAEVVPGSVTGQVTKDGDKGNVTINLAVKVDLEIEVNRPSIVPTQHCAATPINLQLTGVYDQTTDTVTLADPDFSVPTVPTTTACIAEVSKGVNDQLAGSGHAISLEMEGDLWVPIIGDDPNSTALVVDPPSSEIGDEVDLTATVTPDAPGATPTGFVEFRYGTTSLGSAAVDGAGVATLSTSDIPVGLHQLTAKYLGDPTYAQSTSPATEYLVAATPTVGITMPSAVVVDGPARPVTVTVANPQEFGADVENARLTVTVTRSTGTAAFDLNRFKVEWLNGDTWEVLPLVNSATRTVSSGVGAITGFALPAGSSQQIRLRFSSQAFGATPSPTSCGASNPTCPSPMLFTASLDEVDPGTGALVEPIEAATHDFNLVEKTRRASTLAFAGNALRPHTVRQGYSFQIAAVINPNVAGVRPRGLAEVFVDGVQTLVRAENAPLDVEDTEQLATGSGSISAFVQLPPDIEVGTHTVTLRYLGDQFFAPTEINTNLTVLPGVGDPFTCREEGFVTKVQVGTNVELDAVLPDAVASGVSTEFDFSSAVIRMNRAFNGANSAPWVPFPEGSVNAVGASRLSGVTFDLGDHGTGTATALQRQGGSSISGPNPGDETTVDQKITLQGSSGAITVEGQPGDEVPIELEGISFSYILSEANPIQYTMVCTPIEGPLELGEVEVAGTTVSVDPDGPVREKTDGVTIAAETFPNDAAGTVTFSSDVDGPVGSDAVDAGEASLSTDELSPGLHQITASFDATDPSVPDTVSAPVTIKVWYSPRTGLQAFVVAAYVDFTGDVDQQAVLDGAAAIEGGQSKSSFLNGLSKTDAYLTHVVNQMYLDTLGREGDPDGVAFWVAKLKAGMPVSKVAANFYGSGEYHTRVGGTDGAWVDDLYDTLLGRAPDSAGRDYWIAQIPIVGKGVVADNFYQTKESGNFRVTDLYHFFLDRNPSTADKVYWTPIVLKKGDLVLAAALAASPEYAARALERFPVIS